MSKRKRILEVLWITSIIVTVLVMVYAGYQGWHYSAKILERSLDFDMSASYNMMPKYYKEYAWKYFHEHDPLLNEYRFLILLCTIKSEQLIKGDDLFLTAVLFFLLPIIFCYGTGIFLGAFFPWRGIIFMIPIAILILLPFVISFITSGHLTPDWFVVFIFAFWYVIGFALGSSLSSKRYHNEQ